MTMIDYYLLGARVSFCVCKNSCHVVQKLPCCLSGSSLSSDIATQVTCIVCAQCSSKFSSSDVVTCSLLSGGLVFLFPTHSLYLVPLPFSTQVCQGRVSPDECPLSLQVKFLLEFSFQGIQVQVHDCFTTCLCQTHSLKARLWAVGMSITANSPLSKRKESALAWKGSRFMVCCTQVTWQLA